MAKNPHLGKRAVDFECPQTVRLSLISESLGWFQAQVSTGIKASFVGPLIEYDLIVSGRLCRSVLLKF